MLNLAGIEGKDLPRIARRAAEGGGLRVAGWETRGGRSVASVSVFNIEFCLQYLSGIGKKFISHN